MTSLTPAEQYVQSLTYGLIIGTGILSILVCSLRLYARAFVIKIWGLDDTAVCIALVITQIFNGLGVAVVYYGEGQHYENVSVENRATWLKLYYAAMGAFDTSVTDAKCYSQFKLYQITLYQAVLIFVADVVILIAPMAILSRLNMPTRKIVALMAIFGTGIIACIAPIVRFSTLDYLRYGTTDLTYKSAPSLYWMAIEFNMGLVAGSLSSLRPLPFFRRFGSSANSRNKTSSAGISHELYDRKSSNLRGSAKKDSFGMTTTILADTVNESQERIVNMSRGDSSSSHQHV
ncbi:hypothetical protein N7466_003817 [Penicillium verhagenii]|uniref:uncharacterized protein n=1 Tax=Penicillium verhagenii TaxID=1562060 RepID=UPI002544DA54|nr:uncharacterized protein N7466_003817 [Penicillium verhagenii]KAJ5934270.1 hypothetical protein N7466_003817 [Penicillium verhagenii]